MSIPKELRELELHFSASINLSPTDGKRFQLLYYTQLYDTLFSLFARFEVADFDEDSVKVQAIEFIGVNYKGHKSLKIEKISASFRDAKDVEKEIDMLKDGYLHFDFSIRGTGTGTFTRLPKGHHLADPSNPNIMRFPEGEEIVVPKKSTYRLDRKL